MILVDTSVWVNHLRRADVWLTDALLAGSVASHPWVAGELALGGVSSTVLDLMAAMPQAPVADTDELAAFITHADLARTGIGLVDAQLLASVHLLTGGRLATADRKLASQAQRLGVATQHRAA